MLGSVLLQVVSWALGTAAAREGLSTSLLSRWTGFGKVGSALFGGVVAISMVGWFGVQNAVFGQGMAEIVPFTDFLGTQEILPGIMLESRPSTSSGPSSPAWASRCSWCSASRPSRTSPRCSCRCS